ncbi:MAG: monovalent cation/H+ antiporter subunit D family protein, partial [Candidatus Latescibacterota bacterium]
MSSHLPIVPIVLPMIAAPLCSLLRRPALIWPLTTGVGWLVFAACAALLMQVVESGPIVYT